MIDQPTEQALATAPGSNPDPLTRTPDSQPTGVERDVAESVNPTAEDAYWRENFKYRAYASGDAYDRWRPAYQYGWLSFGHYRGKPFDEVEPEMQHEWDNSQNGSQLTWEKAKDASRDAWMRVETATVGVTSDGR